MASKRRQIAAQVAEKKAKVAGPAELQGVIDAIAGAGHLTTECRAMLVAGCAGCLGEYADSRHAHQRLVVELIGQALEESRSGLEAKVLAGEDRLASLDARAAELAGAVRLAEEEKASRRQRAETLERELAAMTETLQVAKRTAAEATLGQEAGDSKAADMDAEKARLEVTLTKSLAAVQAGAADDAQREELLALAAELALDDSLAVALPKTFARPPGERGSFDHLVLAQLEQSIRERIAKLDADLAADRPAAAERAQTALDTERAAQEAADAQQRQATALAAARGDLQQQDAPLATARATAAALESEHERGVQSLEAARAELELFSYPSMCFAMLKDRVPKAPLAEPESQLAQIAASDAGA